MLVYIQVIEVVYKFKDLNTFRKTDRDDGITDQTKKRNK